MRSRGICVSIESAPYLADEEEDAESEEEAYRDWLQNADLEPEETEVEPQDLVSSALRYPEPEPRGGLSSLLTLPLGCLMILCYASLPALIIFALLVFLFG